MLLSTVISARILRTEGLTLILSTLVMKGSRKFCQRGSNFDNVFFPFLVDRGWGGGGGGGVKDPNTTISGPSSARQRKAIKKCFAFCWRAYHGPTFNAGLVAL